MCVATTQRGMGMPESDLLVSSAASGRAAASAATAPAAAAPAPAAPEKTSFDVKLVSFDAPQKLKVIKEVRAITNLGLNEVCALLVIQRASRAGQTVLPLQAKDLVEGAPSVLAKSLKKADAEALVAKMKECGAVTELA